MGGNPNTDLEISIPRSRDNCLLNQELNMHVSHWLYGDILTHMHDVFL